MQNIKDLIKAQIKMELQHSNYNSTGYIKAFLKPVDSQVIDAAEALVYKLVDFPEEKYFYQKDGQTVEWTSLRDTHNEVLRLGTVGIVECFYAALAVVIPKHDPVTLQTVVGTLIGAMSGLEKVYHKLKAVEIVLLECPFLIMDAPKGAEYAYISSVITLDKSELDILRQQSNVLPSIAPIPKIRNNNSIGYRTFKKSIIMGGKHHNFPCNLAHINRRNAVVFRIEPRIFKMYTPVFDSTRKIKKNGQWETDLEIVERETAWNDLMRVMPTKIGAMKGRDMRFNHRYDNRYRTYAEQYFINYQGNDFQKSAVELAEAVIIEGAW